MQTTRLRGTGIEVSRVALGCGGFGGVGSLPALFGRGESDREAAAILDAAWDMGITLLDTADAYGGGRSERAIGRWLRDKGAGARERAVITTKVFHPVEGDPNDRGLSRERILRQIEGSLRRLGVDQVDLYMTHEPDPDTPIDETLEALDAIVRFGKARAVGACNVDGEGLSESLRASAAGSRIRFGCVQNGYSLLDRSAEREVFGVCERDGLGFTAFSPLAGGWLTGKYRRRQAYPAGSRMTLRPESYRGFESPAVFAALDAFEEASRERGVPPASLALAWALSHPRVDAVIVGPRRPEHLAPIAAALSLTLTPEDRAAIGDLFA